jgi:hypothetical protein
MSTTLFLNVRLLPSLSDSSPHMSTSQLDSIMQQDPISNISDGILLKQSNFSKRH